DALHEQVADPVRDVDVMRTAALIAGVVAQLQKRLDIRMPRLEINARSPFALAALIDGRNGRVQGLEPRHDAVRQAVRRADQRPFRTYSMPRDADAAGELRQQRDILVPVVDGFERISGGIEQ